MKHVGKHLFFLCLSLVILSLIHADIQAGTFSLTSPAFKDEGWITNIYACDKYGKNQSPKFQWANVPANTKSFALICNDINAPDSLFIHWVIYNIPAQVDHLEEGISRTEKFPNGIMQGINSFRRLGYDGPCPSDDRIHRYLFTLYALNQILDLDPKATFEDLDRAMAGHVLGQAQLLGLFQKKSDKE